MNNRALLAAFLLCLAPPGLVAQQSADARIANARGRVVAAGVPGALLDRQVAEGRAKNIPADRIAAVIERRATSLVSASRMLSSAPSRSDADLAAGADAIEAGIGEAPIRQIVGRARTEDRAVALAVLTYLHREQGLPVDQALERVEQALAAGPEALRGLPAQAQANRNRGQDQGQRGNRPDGVGGGRPAGVGGGPPAGVPSPGNPPGRGRPDGVGGGRPDNGGRPG